MEIKKDVQALRIVPGVNGVAVMKEPMPGDEGRIMDPPYYFTDHDELAKHLFGYFVDVEGELKERAKRA